MLIQGEARRAEAAEQCPVLEEVRPPAAVQVLLGAYRVGPPGPPRDSPARPGRRALSHSAPGGGLGLWLAYGTEGGFAAAGLGLRINGAGFTDIITTGGTFLSNGYNGVLSSCCGNPLAGRNAWHGNSGGFHKVQVLLPPAACLAPRVASPVLPELDQPAGSVVSFNEAVRPLSTFFDRVWRPEQLPAALLGAMRVLTDPAETGAATIALLEDVQR